MQRKVQIFNFTVNFNLIIFVFTKIEVVYKVKANKIDTLLIEKVKKSFGDKEVYIIDDNELKLMSSISNIEVGKNLISFTAEQFDRLVEKKLSE